MRRVFIPNRGEIAVRIVNACHKLGLQAVVGASEPDMKGMAARVADRVVCIGPGPASESYLRADVVVHAALSTRCDAIHPGYGFLSESPSLSDQAREHGLTFVGPPTHA
ncbi:MAG: biotin carboxylase N-terminal domain-containing protein, partial [Solirubrobacteraceae bacterium]